MNKKGLYFLALTAVFTLSACQSIDEFTHKVVTETQKTAHFTVDSDSAHTTTIQQLIDEGKVDQFVYEDKTYQLQNKVDNNSKGSLIGTISQSYYVDQNGKRWTANELKQPYVYKDPKKIREKKPMVYGSVYSIKSQNKQDKEEIIVEFNHQLYRATLITHS